ncbi:hypothetical protein DER44DRAFT_227985 [Fusarium oxysporum]|nr:hypothetical protein DER44DRAFT_227985 [Fusarium oxysporum]
MFPLLCRLSLLFPSSLFFYLRSLNAHAFIYLSFPSLPPFVLSSNRGSLTLLCFRRRCHSLGTHTLSRFIDAIASRHTQLFVHPPPSTYLALCSIGTKYYLLSAVFIRSP